MRELKTPRLLLRTPRAADAAAITALLNDWDVIEQTAALPFPFTADDAARWLAHDPAQMVAERILLRLVMARLPAGGVVGAIDLFERGGEPSIAYWVGRAHWNQGYASEAAAAFVQHIRQNLLLPRLHAGIFIENAASARVLEKLGFAPDGDFEIDTERRGGRRVVRTYVLECPR